MCWQNPGGLKGEFKIAVVEWDIAGSADAERIGRQGVPVADQYRGNCHLNANMVRSASRAWPWMASTVFIENVGNLVCLRIRYRRERKV